MFKLSKAVLNELPKAVQDEVLDTLKAYNEANVEFSSGKYHVSTGLCIRAEYAPDHKFIGVFCADDIYTPEERDANHLETFGYKAYPSYVYLANRRALK